MNSCLCFAAGEKGTVSCVYRGYIFAEGEKGIRGIWHVFTDTLLKNEWNSCGWTVIGRLMGRFYYVAR